MKFVIDFYVYGKKNGEEKSIFIINTNKIISKQEMKYLISGIRNGFNVNVMMNDEELNFEDFDTNFKKRILEEELSKILDDKNLTIKEIKKEEIIDLEMVI